MIELIPPAILAAVTGALVVYRVAFGERSRLTRRMRREQATSIADARPGTVKIWGTTKVQRPLVAPLTNSPCVAWSITVEQQLRERWDPWFERAEGCRFLVEDDNGSAWVDASDGFQIVDVEVVEEISSADSETPGTLEALLTRRGQAPTDGAYLTALTTRRVRLRQRNIPVDAVAMAMGCAAREPDAEGRTETYRDAPERLVLRGDGRTPLLLTTG